MKLSGLPQPRVSVKGSVVSPDGTVKPFELELQADPREAPKLENVTVYIMINEEGWQVSDRVFNTKEHAQKRANANPIAVGVREMTTIKEVH